MSEMKVKDVIKKHTEKLLALPGVVGIGEGELNGEPCILIFIRDNQADLQKDIPSKLEGYPIVINKSGDFSARG